MTVAGRLQRGSRVRVPELAVGVLLVAAGAFGGLWWHLQSSATVTVTAVSTALGRGATIEEADLVPVEIHDAGALRAVPWDRHAELAGRSALVDLSAGTIVTRGLTTAVEPLALGEARSAVRLPSGGAPAGIAPGDHVDVVAVPPPGTSGLDTDPTVLARSAVVTDVAAAAEADGGVVVTLRLPVDAARRVSALSSSVRLLVVGS